ncbi:MAG: FecR family protein [Thermodesulfobacteriota bacterium]
MKGFMYTLLFLLSVFVSFLMVSSYILSQETPGGDYVLTNTSGKATIQYQTVSEDKEFSKWRQQKADWIPTGAGMKTGSGDRIRTGAGSYADIMREGKVAIRLEENSLLEMAQQEGPDEVMELTLKQGKVSCRVKDEEKPDRKLRVRTETALVGVKGTVFSVGYNPKAQITDVQVLEGVVSVQRPWGPSVTREVGKDEKLMVGASSGRLIPQPLSREEREALLGMEKVAMIQKAGLDRVLNALDLDVFSPVLTKIICKITEAEMSTFEKALKDMGRIRLRGRIPASLRDAELEQGDYVDPWGSDYLYERIGERKAILISAGPDRVFHTRDDLVKHIELGF